MHFFCYVTSSYNRQVWRWKPELRLNPKQLNSVVKVPFTESKCTPFSTSYCLNKKGIWSTVQHLLSHQCADQYQGSIHQYRAQPGLCNASMFLANAWTCTQCWAMCCCHWSVTSSWSSSPDDLRLHLHLWTSMEKY